MDDDSPSHEALEAELKPLRPAAPTRDFLARMARELDAPAAAARASASVPAEPIRRPAPLRWLWLGALPVAAALAVTLAIVSRNRPPSVSSPATKPATITQVPPASPTAAPASAPAAAGSAADRVFASAATTEAAAFKPIAAENVLYAAHDEGLVILDDGTTARRERLNYVDTITWKNPRTNASVRWTVPREEVRVIPIKFQ